MEQTIRKFVKPQTGLAIILSLLLTLILVACGGYPAAPSAPKSAAPAAPAAPAAKAAPEAAPKASAPAAAPAAAPKAAPSAPAVATKAAWEKDWDKTLELAKGEGKVVVTVYRAEDRESVTQFSKTYPDIEVEAVVLSGRNFTARVPAERDAGIYNYDVYLSGGTSAMRIMDIQKKSGKPILGNTRELLIRPDVLGDENWVIITI